VEELEAACVLLLDAPHQEHFAARLNDAEMAGIEAIKVALQPKHFEDEINQFLAEGKPCE